MPLLERARVEVYLPDLPHAAYYNLLEELTQEFTHMFGGLYYSSRSRWKLSVAVGDINSGSDQPDLHRHAVSVRAEYSYALELLR